MQKVAAMVLLAGMTIDDGLNFNEKLSIIRGEKRKIIPNGCNEYFFNKKGKFSTVSMLKTETVFTCVASNDKNAYRKFYKFITNTTK